MAAPPSWPVLLPSWQYEWLLFAPSQTQNHTAYSYTGAGVDGKENSGNTIADDSVAIKQLFSAAIPVMKVLEDGAIQFFKDGMALVNITIVGNGAHKYRYLIASLNNNVLPNTPKGSAGDASNWHYANCHCYQGPTSLSFSVSVRQGDRLRAATVPAHSNLGLATHMSSITVKWQENAW